MTVHLVPDPEASGPETQDRSPSCLAREYLLGTPRIYVTVKLTMGILAVLATGTLDVTLFYNAQSERFIDELGQFTGATLALLVSSAMSLAVFWIIGASYDRGGRWRWLAGLIYLLLIALLSFLLVPGWSGLFANVLGGGSTFDHGIYLSLALIYLGTTVIAVFYTTGGVLWLLAKRYLKACWEEVLNYREAIERKRIFDRHAEAVRHHRRLKLGVEHHTANGLACAEGALPGAIDAYRAKTVELLNHALAICRGIKYTKADKIEARKDISVLEACLKSLNAIKLVSILTLVVVFTAGRFTPAQAAPAAEIIAGAPVFQVLVDVSGNSPGINPDYLAAVWPGIEQRLQGMPVGTAIIIATFGDAALPPLVFRTRIQARHTKDGDTPDRIAHDLRELLLSLPQRFHGHEHRKSEVIGALFTAAQEVNAKAHGNVIVAISDLIENSNYARCDNEKAKPCKLPAPMFHFPPDTAVLVYGVGQGMHSDRAALLTQQWARYFKQAGVGAVLRRN